MKRPGLVSSALVASVLLAAGCAASRGAPERVITPPSPAALRTRPRVPQPALARALDSYTHEVHELDLLGPVLPPAEADMRLRRALLRLADAIDQVPAGSARDPLVSNAVSDIRGTEAYMAVLAIPPEGVRKEPLVTALRSASAALLALATGPYAADALVQLAAARFDAALKALENPTALRPNRDLAIAALVEAQHALEAIYLAATRGTVS